MPGTATTHFQVNFSSDNGLLSGNGQDEQGLDYEFNFNAANGRQQEYRIVEQPGPHSVDLLGQVPDNQPVQFQIKGNNGIPIDSHIFSGGFGPTTVSYDIDDTGPN